MLSQLKVHLNINLIQVYAPTSDTTVTVIEEFSADEENLINNNNRTEA